jgi:wobble nucleotide-excising tRNase
MIGKVTKIKNLGLVFSNYSWDTGLPAFKQFNLMYGWNGSGKTTFSRLFDAVGDVPIPGLEYEIEDDQGAKFKESETFPQKIRVFNQDYVRKNVQVLESQANSISILLGEDNKKLLE